MKSLPIFPYQMSPLELVLPKKTTHNCLGCKLANTYALVKDDHGNALEAYNNVTPKIVKGTEDKWLLVVCDQPSKEEMQKLEAGHGDKFRTLLQRIRRSWRGNIVFDFAKRCHANSHLQEVTPSYQKGLWIEKCRPFLSNAFRHYEYDRIICIGKDAWQAVTGRKVEPLSIRRGFTRIEYKKTTPAYILMDWDLVEDNRFYRKWFQEDLDWALTTQPPVEKQDGICYIIKDEADALQAEKLIREAGSFAIDCEWAGAPYNNDFTLLSIALTAKYNKDCFVWPEELLRDRHAPVVQPLRRVVGDPKVGMYGQYIKVDYHAVWWGLGVEPKGLVLDTQVAIKLLESESDSALDTSNERVGQGGHKDELKDALKAGRAKLIEAAQKRLARIQSREDRERDRYYNKKRKDPRAETMTFGFAEDKLIEKLDEQKLSNILDKKSQFQDQYSFAYVDPMIRDVYNAKDTTTTMRLGEMLEDRIARDSSLPRVWNKLMKPGIETLFKMERNGFPVDRRVMQENIEFFRSEVEVYRNRLAKYGSFNPDSTEMLGKFVFETLGFQHQGLNADGEYVVDDDVLQSFGKKDPIHPDKIEWAHPVFPDMIEYRQLSKFLGTYSEGFLRYVRDDGRVHPQFRPDGARTGRLSCVAPWTQVLTSKGPTPIVGIRPGDLVMTHRGRYKPVLRFIEQGTQPVYTIKLNNGQALTCTSSHRVLTPEGRWVSTQELYDEYQQSMVSVSLKLSTSRTAIKGYNNISSDYRDTQIEGIYHSGNCAVYDLSVADDESYLTEGVFSHNCTEPALQTVPSAEDDVRALMIRRAFVSLPGWSLLKYDFSQLEYKVAAWRSNDPFMIAGFIRGEDIHTITTKAICKYMWGIEPADWDTQPEPTKKSQRKVGKTLNFALMFGMGDEKLALTLGIDKEKAEELRAALMGNYTGYAAFKAWCEQESMRTGYARTAWWDEQGNVIPFRKRQAQQIGSKQRKLQSQGMRIATNTAIQGLASDLCLNALIRIQQWIEDESLPIEIICTIHDALFFHIPNHLVAYAAPIIKHFMEDYNCGGVPITVDGEIGQNWADMIKYTDEIGEYLTTTTSIAEYVETPSYKAYLASKKKAA